MNFINPGHTSDPLLIYTLPTSKPTQLTCGRYEGQLLSIHWQMQWPNDEEPEGWSNFHYKWAQG